MNHTNSLQVPVTKRYKQVLCHSTDVFERRVCDCYIRARTIDDCLPLLHVCCFGTNSTCISLTASHREHHIATNPDQHSFMVIKMAYTFCFNNSLQLLYSKCSLWNIVCKNDVYKIPEVLFISLTLNWH